MEFLELVVHKAVWLELEHTLKALNKPLARTVMAEAARQGRAKLEKALA